MENLFIEHFLSYEDFRSNKEIQALELNEEDLKVIYQVIDQNRFLLCSEHYLPILFQSIMKKTSVSTGFFIHSELVVKLTTWAVKTTFSTWTI